LLPRPLPLPADVDRDPSMALSAGLIEGDCLVEKSATTWHGEALPHFAYDAAAAEYVAGEDDPAYTLDPLISPAFKRVFWANVVLWSFWALFPIVGFMCSTCDEGGGVAKAPSWLLAIYLPVVAYSLYLEFDAHRFVLPACAAWLGGWRMFNRNVPFYLYIGMTMGLSALGHTDLASSALFSARLLKSASCPGNMIEPTWERVVAHSWMRYLPPLPVCALIAWLFMASQLLQALGQSIPCPQLMGRPKCRELSYWLFDEQVDRFCDKNSVWIPTCLQGQAYASQAVHALSTSSRMCCLSFQYVSLFNYAYGKDALGGIKDLKPSRDAFVANMNLCAVNVATFLLLESTLQVNLQISVLLIERVATNKSGLDPLTTLSACLSIAAALYKLKASRSTLINMHASIEPYIQPEDVKEVQDEGFDRLDTPETVAKRRQTVLRARRIFTVSASVTIGLLLYAVAKLLGGTWFCASGLWNLSGCMDER